MDQKKVGLAREYLYHKLNQNINMLASLQAGISEVIIAEEKGCLFCTNQSIWQLAADDEQTALRLYERIPREAAMLEVQEAAQFDLIAQRFQPRCVETYYNAWYAGERFALPDIGAKVRVMTEEDADELAKYYHLPGPSAGNFEETRAYILERIPTGTVVGAFLDGRLAGFVGTHDEGSIGMLTVVPEFRRRGFATYLEKLAIARALECGHIPFGQIARDNHASIALQKSLGMTISDELVCWMDK